jgi:transposase InsO family protein
MKMKEEILLVLRSGEAQGLPRNRLCGLLQVSERRVRRWEHRATLADAKPGPVHAPHGLLPEERTAIVVMARDERYVDDSPRILAAKGSDAGFFAASATTVYRVMKLAGLMVNRVRNTRNGNRTEPDRRELTGPNQQWCWDISYLRTLVKGIFLYLYVMLDEYSRKVVAWRVSWYLSYQEGKELLEEGLANEHLPDGDAPLPSLLNDRGVQMKAKSFKKMVEDLGMVQKFSRPRTPNDNPFIESHFSLIKCNPDYPQQFLDDIDGITYFTRFFQWYNTEHLHGRIGFVTPVQKHTGTDKAILANREMRKKEARKNRLKINRQSYSLTEELALV